MTNGKNTTKPQKMHPLVAATRRKDIWNGLLSLRTLNAVLLCTFFQPDEFYQVQEPAWKLAFGGGKHPWQKGAYDGPWVTWEWDFRLRSSLYPVLLAALYKATAVVSNVLFSPVVTTLFLQAPPKLVGIFTAACMDYYSWKLSERVFGERSLQSTAVLYLTAVSPWQWFVSTRTFSNNVETALTVLALYNWPWSWFVDKAGTDVRTKDKNSLLWAFLFAGYATILRPTNALIWIILLIYTLPRAFQSEALAFIRKASTAFAIVAISSAAVDFFYYRQLTFPPLNFLAYNLGKGIAEFYGTMRPDYYFTEGLPLLLTTALPFASRGLAGALRGGDNTQQNGPILKCLSTVGIALPVAFSLLSHKEVRFIYPVLPIFHILAAQPLVNFFQPFPWPSAMSRKIILIMLLGINGLLALYFGSFHGRGVIGAQAFLRSEHELKNPGMMNYGTLSNMNKTTVGWLMPCHSVPWRSQLVYHDIEGWALTCDPPLNLTRQEKLEYVDEADQFYEDPVSWTRREFALRRRFWPEYIVFFEQLEEAMKTILVQGTYKEVWRGFNSLVHDDWRRRGDVIIWQRTGQYGLAQDEGEGVDQEGGAVV